MWIILRPEHTPETVVDGQPSTVEALVPVQRKRRGVTAMEYLVMASLIITVLIATIQSIGKKTGKSLTDSSDAIQATMGS